MAKDNFTIRMDADTRKKYEKLCKKTAGNPTVSAYMRWVLETHISKEYKDSKNA